MVNRPVSAAKHFRPRPVADAAIQTYIMSDSPPTKEADVEQSAQTGEESDHMDREQEGTQQGLGDFEVKEQDRWLPIANGWLRFICTPVVAVFDLFVPCVTYCVFACLTMALCESRGSAVSRTFSRAHLIRCVYLTSAMICIAAHLSLVNCI